MKYITCDILGPGDGKYNFGLCNQMFQVAALTSHAYDNNLIAAFPQLKHPNYGSYYKNIFSKVNTESVDYRNYKFYEVKYGYYNLPSEGGIMYKGYMQSEKYFLHNRNLILNLFAPTPEIADYIKTKYSTIFNQEVLSIHVRRGDYVNLPNHHPLISPEYYSKAVEYITSKINIGRYVVFSDDINYCRTIFGESEDITYIEGEEDYIDLYLMSMCQHNIIANSTFSWWGAWLNQNPNKIVVAPERWFGTARADLNIKDLIPETWIKI